MSREMDVELSIHTPYYMDLVSNSDLTDRCNRQHQMGRGRDRRSHGRHPMVVTHLGLYGDGDRKEGQRRPSLENVERLHGVVGGQQAENRWWAWRPQTAARRLFGSLDEIPGDLRQHQGNGAVINFAYVHAREAGGIEGAAGLRGPPGPREDYVDGHYYTHFSGVEHEAGNEKRITPIKKGDLRFEPLAEFLADENPDISIISSSPLLEHDAMYMKVIYERVLTKRVAKEARAKKSNNKAPEAAEDEEDLAEDLELDDIDKPPGSRSTPRGARRRTEEGGPQEREEGRQEEVIMEGDAVQTSARFILGEMEAALAPSTPMPWRRRSGPSCRPGPCSSTASAAQA